MAPGQIPRVRRPAAIVHRGVFVLAMAGLPWSAQAAVDAPRTVVGWINATAGTAEADALLQASDAFNRSQRSYRVELLSSNHVSYVDRVHSLAAAGLLPCVLAVDGPHVAGLAWAGYLQPLDGYMPAGLRGDLLPSILAQGRYRGRTYSLGQFESGLGLWANRRYLRAARVRLPTVERPWTLPEFEDALARLARVEGVEYPLSLALYTGTSEFLTYAYAPLLQGFGGDLVDRPGMGRAHGVLDGPRSVAAMHHLQHWFAQGWTRPVYDRNDDFEQRRTALVWSGHWRYRTFHEALKDDLVLLPLPDFGAGIKTGMGSWAWSMSSTCSEPEGAWAFIAHLLSPPEVRRITEAIGAIPARKSLLAASKLYGGDGPLAVYGRQLREGKAVPRPQTPAYATISKEFSAAVSAIVAGEDVQAALSRAAAAIDQDIAAHRGYRP